MGFLAVAWFFWRRHRRLNHDFSFKQEQDQAFAKPSRGERILARIPFLKDRFAQRTWQNIDEQYYQEKNNSRASIFIEKSASVKSTSRPRLD